MGSIVTKLQKETSDYINLIKYVNDNKDKFLDIKYITKLQKQYLSSYKNKELTLKTMSDQCENAIKDLSYINFMYTINNKTIILKNDDLMIASIVNHTNFCVKIIPKLEKYNYKKWKYAYCEIFPTVPNIDNMTLEQQFMWHAHLSNKSKYKLDCQRIFSYLLDYRNIDYDLIEKYHIKERKMLKTKEIEKIKIYDNTEKNTKNDSYDISVNDMIFSIVIQNSSCDY